LILLLSASQVIRIIGMSHRDPTSPEDLLKNNSWGAGHDGTYTSVPQHYRLRHWATVWIPVSKKKKRILEGRGCSTVIKHTTGMQPCIWSPALKEKLRKYYRFWFSGVRVRPNCLYFENHPSGVSNCF
jgi:hypothetical protein